MNEFLIKNYISKLSIKEINTISKKQGLNLTQDELILIEKYIKNDWKTIIYGNPKNIFDDLKKNLNIDNYNKLEKLYNEFKNKYKNYL